MPDIAMQPPKRSGRRRATMPAWVAPRLQPTATGSFPEVLRDLIKGTGDHTEIFEIGACGVLSGKDQERKPLLSVDQDMHLPFETVAVMSEVLSSHKYIPLAVFYGQQYYSIFTLQRISAKKNMLVLCSHKKSMISIHKHRKLYIMFFIASNKGFFFKKRSV